MARSEFQPLLSGGAVQSPGSNVSTTDFSGIAKSVGTIFGNTQENLARKRAEQQAFQNATDASNLQDNLLALHQERERGALAEQNLRDRIVSLEKNGDIGADAVTEFDGIAKQLESLKQFKAQGLGNDGVFRMKRNELLRQAQASNPLIYDEIRQLFGHDIADPTQSGSSGNVAGGDMPNQLVIDNLRTMYGDQFGVEEYNKYLKNQAVVANYETNKKLGAITASNVYSKIDDVMNATLYQWHGSLQHSLGSSGVLGIEQQEGLERGLEQARQAGYAELDSIFERAAQTGEIISIEDRRAHYARVDDLIGQRKGLMQGKDLHTRSKQYMELYDMSIEMNMPDLVRYYSRVGGGEGGLGAINQLMGILQSPHITAAAAATTQPWMKHVAPEDLERAKAEVYTLLLNGVQLSPEMQRMGAAISTHILGTSPRGEPIAPPIVKAGLEALESASGGPEPDTSATNLPANMRDAMKVATSPKWAENFLESADTQDLKQMAMISNNWVSTALRMTAELPSDAVASIQYDPTSGKFSTTANRSRVAGPFPGAPIGGGKVNQIVELLNSIGEVTSNSKLAGVVPPKEKFLEQFFATQDAIQEMLAEGKAKKAAEAEGTEGDLGAKLPFAGQVRQARQERSTTE